MGRITPSAKDPELRKIVEEGLGIYKASQSWYWRGLAFLVVLAAIASAVFEGLSYCCD